MDNNRRLTETSRRENTYNLSTPSLVNTITSQHRHESTPSRNYVIVVTCWCDGIDKLMNFIVLVCPLCTIIDKNNPYCSSITWLERRLLFPNLTENLHYCWMARMLIKVLIDLISNSNMRIGSFYLLKFHLNGDVIPVTKCHLLSHTLSCYLKQESGLIPVYEIHNIIVSYVQTWLPINWVGCILFHVRTKQSIENAIFTDCIK